MSAQPNSHDVITKNVRRAQSFIAVLLGIILTLLVQQLIDSREIIDSRMESACKFPRSEGEMTVITVINQKLICWRWQ